MGTSRLIRICIADGQALVRNGLAAFLMASEELKLVGEAGTGEEAFQLCERTQPDILLMDLQIPGMDSQEVARRVQEQWPQIKLLMLTCVDDFQTVRQTFSAGAAGYLLKDIDARELEQAIRLVYDSPQEGLPVPHVEPSKTNLPAQIIKPADEAKPDHQSASYEMADAARIQASILPQEIPGLEGYELAARLQPARETSGDFYDFLELPNGSLGIVIADVTDKGMGAALFMALSSTLIRTYVTNYPTLPGFAMGKVNQRILSDTHGSMFVTAFLGVLEPQLGRLRYVNAGHNPPLLLSSQKGKPVDRLNPTGVALGLLEKSNWSQKICRLSSGDCLLLYTDGVTEAHNSRGEMFGEGRLQEVARSRRTCTSESLLQSIFDELARFTGGAVFEDDVALLVLSRK